MSISKNAQIGPVIFQFSNNFVIFFDFFEKIVKLLENWKMTGPIWAVWEMLNVELIFERYKTIPWQEKIQTKKYYFVMEKFNFQNVEFEQNCMQFAK